MLRRALRRKRRGDDHPRRLYAGILSAGVHGRVAERILNVRRRWIPPSAAGASMPACPRGRAHAA